MSLLETARREFADAPFVGKRIDELLSEHGDTYRRVAERHLRALFDSLERDPRRFSGACRSFLEMTFEVVRMQNAYYRTGRFAAAAGQSERDALRRDPDLMIGRYLTGLYLAQVFWKNHFEKLLFFEEEFLPRVRSDGALLDVGTGPGSYALLALRRHPDLTVVCNDVSPYSRPMVERLASPLTGNRSVQFHFVEGDFVEAFDPQDAGFDAVVFSEVVEHLDRPEKGMEQLASVLDPRGVVFFTTATNAAFYDHTIVFKDTAEIESLLDCHGFEVVSEQLSLVFKGASDNDVLDYNAILRRRERPA
ncbi:MAG: methyltransferase domain-containing protein [Myxococcota bacterium]